MITFMKEDATGISNIMFSDIADRIFVQWISDLESSYTHVSLYNLT